MNVLKIRRYQPWVYLTASLAAITVVVWGLTVEMDSTLSTDETQYAVSIPTQQQQATPTAIPAAPTMASVAIPTAPAAAPAPALTQPEENPSAQRFWKQIHVQSGDNLSSIFTKYGFSQQQLSQILALGNKKIAPFLNLHAGNEIDVLVDGNNQILQLTTQPNPLQILTLTHQGNGFQLSTQAIKPEAQLESVSATIKGSLYGTAQQNNISPKLINQLSQIFSSQINFSKNLHPGDHFTVIYQNLYAGNEKLGLGDVVAAEITTQGKTYQAIRYKGPDGRFHYYTPAGRSLEPGFLRYPVNYERISSTFSMRRFNPVLHIVRPHYGVDFAAPTGTPVRATGDGIVEFAGPEGGYGRVVILDHADGYSTRYAHLSRFAKNLKAGQRVKEGQLIGYVGSTGVATGPNLHYEVRINDKPYNPLTVKLPGAPGLTKQQLRSFLPYSDELMEQLTILSERNATTPMPGTRTSAAKA